MKIMLTGAAGQVGKAIVQAVKSSSSHEVIPLTRDDCELTDTQRIGHLMNTHQAELVINTAAYTQVDKAETEADIAYAVNAEAVKGLAMACESATIPLIQLSSDYVFNGKSTHPYTELSECDPLGVYGKSKRLGEENALQHCSQSLVLRTSWVFGESGHNFVKAIVAKALTQSELSVVNDQWGAPTSADCIANACLQIASKLAEGQADWGIFHYAGMPSTSWYDFAANIVDLLTELGHCSSITLNPIDTVDFKTAAPRPRYSVLECQKILSVYGIRPCLWKKSLRKLLTDWNHNHGKFPV